MAESSFTRFVYDRSPVWFQNLMTTVYGWEKGRYRYGSAQARTWLKLYRETTTWTEEQLREYQWQQLQDTLRHANARVPYYRRMLQELGLTPESIRTVADMRQLPLLTKDRIRAAGHDLISDGCDPAELNQAPTSGSTGMPMVIYSDREAAWRDFAHLWVHCRPGLERGKDAYASFTGLELVSPAQRKPPFWRMNYAAKQRVYSVFHLSDGNMPYYLEDLARFKPIWLYGYPSALFTLADFALRSGWRFPSPPRVVITSSEQCLPEYREAIEKAFQTRVWDEYGQVEMGGSAFQCACGKLHEKPSYSLVEFLPLREENGLQVCEMVCTSFINKAMPLIRYQVGDLALLDPRASCPLGKPGRVIEQIYGRTAQFILCGDGSRVSNISVMAKKCRNVKSMQAVQEAPGEVILRVVPLAEFDRREDAALIEREFRKKLGDESRMRLRIELVDCIELTASGKFLSIVNRIGKASGGAGDGNSTSERGPAKAPAASAGERSERPSA